MPPIQFFYGNVKSFRGYSPNARSKLSHEVMSSILWIVLLQSSRFFKEKWSATMHVLGSLQTWGIISRRKIAEAFTTWRSHQSYCGHWEPNKPGVEPTSITWGGGSREVVRGDQARKCQLIVHTYSTNLEEFLKKPRKDAGNPTLGKFCDFCGVTSEKLQTDLKKKTSKNS